MGQDQPSATRLEFESWGFPTLARMSGTGITISGWVQDSDTEYQNAWAYQLYSENAAAAFGDPLNGLSGAPCIIDGAAVGIIRSNLVDPTQPEERAHIAAGILYACPLATETLQERCAAYLPSLDPIRGLPGLPRQELPLEPFRYLHWYGTEHAEVFFGRNRKIRELYDKLTKENVPPLVLVYGASGVGKSSLLEAGLLPRLRLNNHVLVRRRHASASLDETLHQLLEVAIVRRRASDKPIIIFLDQIEEALTDPRLDGKVQLNTLSNRIKTIFADTKHVSTRIVLGFRSEWLAHVRSCITDAAVQYSELYLERLDREEIQEVVRGVASTSRLRTWYDMQVDKGLPANIADDLLRDPHSPISPVLSIILTRLWEDAKRQPAGAQRLSKQTYDVYMRNKVNLRTFLHGQIAVVAKERPADESSGLINDLLYRHTTDQSTAKAMPWQELHAMYSHLEPTADSQSPYLLGLIDALGRHALLYQIERKNVTNEQAGDELNPVIRLAHDTLAPLVRSLYETSIKPGQRAERILRGRVQDWDPKRPTEALIEPGDLTIVESGLAGMRKLTDTERHLLDASMVRRNRNQTVRRILQGLALTMTCLIIGFAITIYLLYQRAEEGRTSALNAQYEVSIRELNLRKQLGLTALALSRDINTQLEALGTAWQGVDRGSQTADAIPLEAFDGLTAAVSRINQARVLPGKWDYIGSSNDDGQFLTVADDRVAFWSSVETGFLVETQFRLPGNASAALKGEERAGLFRYGRVSSSSDGSRIAIQIGGFSSSLISLFDPKSTRSIVELSYPTTPYKSPDVHKWALSPLGDYFAATLPENLTPHRRRDGSFDVLGATELGIWLAKSGEQMGTLAVNSGYITAVAISPVRNLIAAGDSLGGLTVWHLQDKQIVAQNSRPKRVLVHDGFETRRALQTDRPPPSGRRSATRGVRPRAIRRTADVPASQAVTEIIFDKEGTNLYAVSGDGRVRIWKISPSTTNTKLVVEFPVQSSDEEDGTDYYDLKIRLAFKLHQFLSGAGHVYATLRRIPSRRVTLDGQRFDPDDPDARLYATFFCRNCGQEHHPVSR
jgi:hypothetical protein